MVSFPEVVIVQNSSRGGLGGVFDPGRRGGLHIAEMAYTSNVISLDVQTPDSVMSAYFPSLVNLRFCSSLIGKFVVRVERAGLRLTRGHLEE